MQYQVITKLEMRQLGLKTANVQRLILKTHKNCASQGSVVQVLFDVDYVGYIVDCTKCTLTNQQGLIA